MEVNLIVGSGNVERAPTQPTQRPKAKQKQAQTAYKQPTYRSNYEIDEHLESEITSNN